MKLDKSNLKCLEIRTYPSHFRIHSGLVQSKILVPYSQNYSVSLEVLKIDVILTNLQNLYSVRHSMLHQLEENFMFNHIIEDFALLDVLQPLLNFLERLLQIASWAGHKKTGRGGTYFKVFKELEINFIPEPDFDWFFYLGMPMTCWSGERFDEKQEKLWRDAIKGVIMAFESRVNINQNYTRLITVKGIPFLFFDIVLEEVYYSLEEEVTYKKWEGEHQKFGISTERHGRFFDMKIQFY